MPRALIVVEPSRSFTQSSTLLGLLSAIESEQTKDELQVSSVEVIEANHLKLDLQLEEIIFCPLTLTLPDNFSFPQKRTFQLCQDVPRLRQELTQKTQVRSGDGRFWLPVVLTAKGPLYSEVIAFKEESIDATFIDFASLPGKYYYQPFHLSDTLRQPLYQMAHQLLHFLSAPPATYLVQFGLQANELLFDRLWPFPTAPALASIDVQQPDLFTCHWYCLAARPVLDLTIFGFHN